MKIKKARRLTIAALINAARLSGISSEMIGEIKDIAECRVSPDIVLGVSWDDLLRGTYWKQPIRLQVELFNRLA